MPSYGSGSLLTDVGWEKACMSHLLVSPASNDTLIQLYIIHYAYLTLCILYAMGRMTSEACVRFYQPEADFLHICFFFSNCLLLEAGFRYTISCIVRSYPLYPGGMFPGGW